MRTAIKLGGGLLTLGILLFLSTKVSYGQYQYADKALLHIINDIEEQTTFRFLYRDALVANISLSFNSTSNDLFPKFETALNKHDLHLKVDPDQKQAIIFQRQKNNQNPRKVTIRGQVVDAQTGERLPYATVSWQQSGNTKGLGANESGAFTIDRTFNATSVEISCSYIGYDPKEIVVDFSESNNIQELTFRLQPNRIDGNQLLVTGTNYYSDVNRQAANLVDIGTFNVMGENNTVRALQSLPAVSPSPAVSDGLHVRGSPSDGFRVLIDGITIYNQTHLFGLIDSFNGDILQRSGFYYDVAPAKLQAPPGGTLSLLTKTGSLEKLSGAGGISNSSARLTLEGPIKKGRSSWLISGRKSYINTINWLNNADLVSHGLNIDRDQGGVDEGLIDLQSQLIQPGKTDASFYDLHSKLYFEGKSGNRLILSGYFGGDDTRQNAERLFRTTGENSFNYEPVFTSNDWQNVAASAQYQQWFSDQLFSKTTIGTSIYQTSFIKDDFTYTQFNIADESLQSFIFIFENQSVLNEFKAQQEFELNTAPWLWSGGISYHYYIGEYYENSFDRPGYFSSRNSHKIDAYIQTDYTGWDILDIYGGLRTHYFTNGKYLRWSPRFKFKLFPDARFSIAGGFSRNHQFLNQIKFSNSVTSDVWILAGQHQPPTSVSYYSSGIYYSFSDYLYAQSEAYYKKFENVRLHEINAFSLSNTFNTNPFYIDNSGTAKGIEFLIRAKIPVVSLTQTFAISEVKLSNPSINNGEPFYADWDRTYRYGATLGTHPLPNFSLYLSWMFASGRPNKLATFGPQNENRLGNYQRTDISAEYQRAFQSFQLDFSVSVFNLLDRQNPWYRELSVAVDQNSTPSQFRGASVNIYDIGLQPSFNIGIKF